MQAVTVSRTSKDWRAADWVGVPVRGLFGTDETMDGQNPEASEQQLHLNALVQHSGNTY